MQPFVLKCFATAVAIVLTLKVLFTQLTRKHLSKVLTSSLLHLFKNSPQFQSDSHEYDIAVSTRASSSLGFSFLWRWFWKKIICRDGNYVVSALHLVIAGGTVDVSVTKLHPSFAAATSVSPPTSASKIPPFLTSTAATAAKKTRRTPKKAKPNKTFDILRDVLSRHNPIVKILSSTGMLNLLFLVARVFSVEFTGLIIHFSYENDRITITLPPMTLGFTRPSDSSPSARAAYSALNIKVLPSRLIDLNSHTSVATRSLSSLQMEFRNPKLVCDDTPVLLPALVAAEVGWIESVVDGDDLEGLLCKLLKSVGLSKSSPSPTQEQSSTKQILVNLVEAMKIFRWTMFSFAFKKITFSVMSQTSTTVLHLGEICLSTKEDYHHHDPESLIDDEISNNDYGRISVDFYDVYGSVNDVNFLSWDRVEAVAAVTFIGRRGDDGDDNNGENKDGDDSTYSPLQIQLMANFDSPSIALYPLHLSRLKQTLDLLPARQRQPTANTTFNSKRTRMKQILKTISHISIHTNIKSLRLSTALPSESKLSLEISVISFTTSILPSSRNAPPPLLIIESRKYLCYLSHPFSSDSILRDAFGDHGALKCLDIDRLQLEVRLKKPTPAVEVAISNVQLEITSFLFTFFGDLIPRVVSLFGFTYSPAPSPPSHSPDDLSEAFKSLKNSTNQRNFDVVVNVTNITAIFPHTDPTLASSIQGYISSTYASLLAEDHIKKEIAKINSFRFSLESDPCEEFEIHMNDIVLHHDTSNHDQEIAQSRDRDRDQDRNSPHYVEVDWFGLTQTTPSKHINIFMADATVNWTPTRMLRVIRVSRDITFSVWVMLTNIRWSLGPSIFPGTMPYDDENALERVAAALPNFIAGTGSVLNRLLITNITANLNFESDESNESAALQVRLKHFISNDLPEHFLFRDVEVSILSDDRNYRHDVVQLDEFAITHCIDGDEKKVSGRRLIDFRVRNHLINKIPLEGLDGFQIKIRNVIVLLPHAIANLATKIQPLLLNSFATFLAMTTHTGTWTPESDSRFRRVFWRPPPTSNDYGYSHDGCIRSIVSNNESLHAVFPKPTLWLKVENFAFLIIDDPFEAWLDNRNKRKPPYDDDVVPNAFWRSSYAFAEDKGKIPFLLKCSMDTATVVIAPITEKQQIRHIQRTFCDNPNTGVAVSSGDDDITFDLLEFAQVDIEATTLTVILRSLSDRSPLLSVDKSIVSGCAVASLPSPNPDDISYVPVTLDDKNFVLPIPATMPKVFVDMGVHCDNVCISFEPYSVFALQECAGVCARLWPPAVSLSMRWWDALRSIINSKLHTTIENTVISLIDERSGETVLMSVGFLRINHFMQKIAVEGAGLTLGLQNTDIRTPLVQIPILVVGVQLFWLAENEDVASGGLSISATISLKGSNGDGNIVSFNSAVSERQSMMRLKMSTLAPDPTITFFFDEYSERLLNWAKAYKKIPPAPFPKKCRGINLGIKALVEHCYSINSLELEVETFALDFCLNKQCHRSSGNDDSFIGREKGSNEGKRRIRIAINKPISGHMSLLRWNAKMKLMPDPFVSGLVLITEKTWCIHDVMLSVEEVEGDIGGDFLFSLERIRLSMLKSGHGELGKRGKGRSGVEVEGVSSSPAANTDIHLDREKSQRRIRDMLRTVEISSGDPNDDGSSVNNNKYDNIEDSVKQGNIDCDCDGDGDGDEPGFLFTVVADNIKLLVTKKMVENLLQIGGHCYKHITRIVTSGHEPGKLLEKYLKENRDSIKERREGDMSSSEDEEDEYEDEDGNEDQDKTNAEFLRKRFGNRKSDSRRFSTTANSSTRFFFDGSSSMTTKRFFCAEINSPQVQLLDEKTNSCIIFALGQGKVEVINGLQIGADAEDCQKLLYRKVATHKWTEAVLGSVVNIMLHVAPTNVDLNAGLSWLPVSAFCGKEGRKVDGTEIVGGGGLDEIMLGEKYIAESDRSLMSPSSSSSSLSPPSPSPPRPSHNYSGASKFGIFLPIFVGPSDAGIDFDVLVVHSTMEPTFFVKLKLAEMNLGVDEQQFIIMSDVLKGLAALNTTIFLADETTADGIEDELFKDGSYVDVWDREKSIQEIWRIKQMFSWEINKEDKSRTELQRRQLVVNRDDATVSLQERLTIYMLYKRQQDSRPNLQFNVSMTVLSISLKVKEEFDGIGGGGRDPFMVLKLENIESSVKSYNAGEATFMFNLHKLSVSSYARSHVSSPLVSSSIFSGFDLRHEKRLRAAFGNSSKLSKRLPAVWDEKGSVGMVNVVIVVGDKVGKLPLIRLVEVNMVPIVCNLSRGVIQKLVTFLGKEDERGKIEVMEEEGRDKFLLEKKKKGVFKRVGGVFKMRRNRRVEKVVERKEGGGGGVGGGGGGGESNGREDVLTEIEDTPRKRKLLKKDSEEEPTALKSTCIFQRLRVGEIHVFVSYKGEKWANLEDIDDMHITLHQLLYSNRTCTPEKLLLSIRKKVVLDLLSQVSRNFEHIGMFLISKFNIGSQIRCDGSGWGGGGGRN